MLVQWTEELATGIGEIDAQHREIFSRFDNFLAGCQKVRGRQALEELYLYLDRYVTEHFAAEEALMDRHGYPEKARHKGEHQDFTGKLAALKKELEDRGATLDVLFRTNKALVYWLTAHIRETDFRLADFLREKAEHGI